MITVDKILLNLVQSNTPVLEEVLAKRDSKVLRSLTTAITSPPFITENQAKLLIKILSENSEKLCLDKTDVSCMLEAPTWSRHFREVDRTKKLYTGNDAEGDLVIIVEFAFSAGLRTIMQAQEKKITGLVTIHPGKVYHADLTEKNIVFLVDTFKKLDFDIDEKLVNFYNTIKSWSKKEVTDQFYLTNITHDNFQSHITADLGIDTAINQNIINDRSLRYQYFTEENGKNPENLTETLATRNGTRVWVDKKNVSIEEIFQSLIELKRFPVLLVFDGFDEKRCFQDLTKIGENLEKNGIFTDVGIYFRLENSEIGKEFNKFIADKKYNSQLTEHTKVVGVQNGKIPKFLLKSAWTPMSVISLSTSLRNTKTSVYANCCDLVITYSDAEPLIESRIKW
jgi:hypothetical protein